MTEIDSPTSRTCQMGFRILGQRSPWASARTASKMAQAAVFSSVPRAASNDSLFGGTSISIAGPAPSGAAISARGRGAGRHVRCPVECPHACARPRGPAPPPPFVLCEDPRNEASARQQRAEGGVGGRGPSTQTTAQRRRGDRPTAARLCIPLRDGRWQGTKTCRVSRHTCSNRNPVSTVPEQPCSNSSCFDRHLGYIKRLRSTFRVNLERKRISSLIGQWTVHYSPASLIGRQAVIGGFRE